MRMNDANRANVVDLSPQEANKGVDCVLFDVAPLSPNGFDNRSPGYDASFISDKKLHKPEFGKGQADFYAFAKCSVGPSFKDKIAVLEHVSCLWSAAPPKRPDARQ